SSYLEGILSAIKQNIGDFLGLGPTAIYGCNVKIDGLNASISSGVILFNDEFFLISSSTILAPTGTDVIVFDIVTSQYTSNADPVLFTDAISRNVHNINTLSIRSGASGSGY